MSLELYTYKATFCNSCIITINFARIEQHTMLSQFLANIFHIDQHKLFSVAGYNEAQASACILILRVLNPNITLLQLTTTCGLDSRHDYVQGEFLANFYHLQYHLFQFLVHQEI